MMNIPLIETIIQSSLFSKPDLDHMGPTMDVGLLESHQIKKDSQKNF